MSRQVLITGGGGFVGAHLAQGLLARGCMVTALDRVFDAPTRARLAGATLIEAELTRDSLQGVSADLVIHGAAWTTSAAELGIGEDEHIGRNTALLSASLAFAAASGATDFVFLSSSGVFDDAAQPAAPLLESTQATSALAYAVAKRAGEAATAGADTAGLRTVSVRLGPIYGPYEAGRETRQTVSQIRRWLDQARLGQLQLTLPTEMRDWTYGPDLAGAMLAMLALEPRLHGTVHLTSAMAHSNEAVAAAIAMPFDAVVKVEPTARPPRRAMASERLDLATLWPWTPLAAGLAQTLAHETIQ